LKLDSPASAYLSNLPKSWARVTVRDLLAHSSGVPSYNEMAGFAMQLSRDVGPAELMKPVFGLPLNFVPGTSSKYSNSDYFLLGLILQKVSHQTLGAYLSKSVFAPLGMRRTHLEQPHETGQNRAIGYSGSGTTFSETPYVSPNVIWAAGGFVSSARDLARWDIGLHSGNLLKASWVATMQSPTRLGGPYGFGSEIGTFHGRPTAGHQGSGIGFNTDYFVLPTEHLSVIVLCNSTRAPSEEIARHVASLCVPGLSDEGKPAIADTNLRITARVRHILQNAAIGIADPTDFSLTIDKGFFEFLKRGGPKMLGPLGAIKQLDLIASTLSVRRYRVQYEKGRLTWEFKFDAKGLVETMEPTKE